MCKFLFLLYIKIHTLVFFNFNFPYICVNNKRKIMNWIKCSEHLYFSRNGKEKFNVTLWALQDEHGNTMYQVYKPIGETPEKV